MSALAAWVLATSAFVTDHAGHRALHSIPKEGAEAIASACEKQPTDEARATCSAVYLVQAFRESGYDLSARGDCRDHITGELYRPINGKCREGDGEPLSYGPFQMRRAPKTWAQAVADFTPALVKSATTCADALAMVASGSCTNKAGIAISRERMALAHQLVADHAFKPEGDT
jgi:hypothetical protein